MLPPFESNLKSGTTLTVLPRPQQKWGVAICKDMDFASPARLYGEAGVGLMPVPGWDFVVDGSWHGHIAVMRGVEDGFDAFPRSSHVPIQRPSISMLRGIVQPLITNAETPAVVVPQTGH
jgi:hypothetical protein